MYNPANLDIGIDDTVVDIGANIGVFTLFAACKTQNHVHSFEPFPKNFEFLNRNIGINNLHNVRIHAAAVCDKVGTQKLFVNDSNTSHFLSSLNTKERFEKSIEVPTTTLEDIMDSNNLKQIDFLKLDCEGAEGAILQSTTEGYLKRVRKIAMEFHDNTSPLKHDEIEKLLIESGFKTKLDWNGRKPYGYLYGFRTSDSA